MGNSLLVVISSLLKKSLKYAGVFLVVSLWHLHVYQILIIVTVAASTPLVSYDTFIDKTSAKF